MSGNIPAYYGTGNKNWDYIQTLSSQTESGTITFSGKCDVDNDGKNEYIIGEDCWDLYGGMFIDIYKGTARILAEGEGTASVLSHTSYQGAEWIVYSDTSHSGRQAYVLKKYDGNGKVTDTIRIGAEYGESDAKYSENSHFYYNDKDISMKEYENYLDEIFGKK